MHSIWEDVVHRNMYITGGIGAQGKNEGFGLDYDLPNETAYCETCASVGMVFWNQRMNMLTGDAKYIDVLEKSLYNGALDGLSLSGDRFFYGNPLASSGTHQRREWFGTACCPSNVARLVASLGNYIYSQSANALWVNLFIGSDVKVPVQKQAISLSMQTGYPWKGSTTIMVKEAPSRSYQLRLRKPGWMKEPAPGGLYHYKNSVQQEISILLNGKPLAWKEEQGYVVLERKWKKGDVIEVVTPMEVRMVVSRPELKQNTDRVALQYGPLVYCVEGPDNGSSAWNFIVPSAPAFTVSYEPGLLGGVNTLSFNGKAAGATADGQSLLTREIKVKAIPYFTWNNRGAAEMQVWLPTAFRQLKVNPSSN
jgi:DUF1680 family protein